ncbi:MAG TPA: response regulator [Verrucomicrobiae bacterium]|jgi:two-component system, OmpR family, response regulator|nr:response regulator [Verrucomicrobiae bacterium]
MTQKKILVVDDEGGMTRMLKRNLEATNRYIVRAENSGAAALAAAREFRPDLILLDVMMPGVDGAEIAGKIREDKLLNQTPIVFLSAIVKKDEMPPTGGQIGGLTFLAKPVKLDDLITCIENQLGK